MRGGDASHGNDGDFGTEHDGKRCTETQSEPSPWWKVDLLKPYAVKVVRVTTRGCCGEIKCLYFYKSLFLIIILTIINTRNNGNKFSNPWHLLENKFFLYT